MTPPYEPVGDRSGDWSDEPDADGDEEAPPAWFPGGHLPEHARRMGLTHHVPEGALLDFAGKLDSTKPLHRITAWVMLAVFVTPALFYALRLLGGLHPG